MNYWLFSLIGRIIKGEPLRKAGPADYRFYFAFLMLLPIEVAAFAFNPFGKRVLDYGSSIEIWAYNCAAIVIGIVALLLCAKYIPATISMALAICIWASAFWIVWHRT